MNVKNLLITFFSILVFVAVLSAVFFIFQSDQEYEVDTTLPFEDVDKNAWYYEYLVEAYDRGWIKGIDWTLFAPDAPIQRGNFATMLYRYLGEPDVAGMSNPFTDLDGQECKNAVIYLHKLEILDGKTETLFAPEEGITREQLVTMLYRMGGYEVHSELSPSGKFTDRDHISDWAIDAVDWGIENGFFTGLTDTILAPREPATRAQAVKILCLYGQKAGYKTDTSSEGKNITLQVWQAGIDDSNAALTMKKLLNRFEKRNPGVNIEYTPLPTKDSPYEKIESALKKGEGPDVILVSAPYEMLLADQGWILPLDTLLTDSVMKDVHPGLLIDCSYDRNGNPELKGKLVSAPLFSTPRALLINRSLFDHFDVEYPDNSYFYDTLLSDAQNLTGSKDGKVIYGFGTRASSPCLFLGMLWSAGGSVIDKSTGLASTNNALWEQTTESYLRLYTEQCTPDHSVSMDYNSQLGMFAKGSVAMIDASLDAASLIRSKDEWIDNLAVYPYLDSAPSACLCVGEVAVLVKNTEHIVDGAKLINFLMEPDSQIIYSKGVGYLPGVMNAMDESDLTADPYLAPYSAGMADTRLLGDKGYAVYGLIRDELQRVLRKELPVKDFCAGLQDKINSLLQ